MLIEKRKAKRRDVGHSAWVDFGPGTRVQQCLIKNMSEIGARLALAVPRRAPAEFMLQFSPDGSVGRRCLVRWQRGGEIGVKFTARVLNRRRGSGSFRILDC
jgi:hypothetical protein